MILKTRSGADEKPVPAAFRSRRSWGIGRPGASSWQKPFLTRTGFSSPIGSLSSGEPRIQAGGYTRRLLDSVCVRGPGQLRRRGTVQLLHSSRVECRGARRIIFLICGPLMLLMIPAVYTTHLWLLIAEFGLATLGYAACATIFLTLPSDLFESGSVATVSGLAGMVTGFVTIAATRTIGAVTDKYSFAPILLGASAAPVLAAIAVLALVRNTRNTGNGVLLRI